MKTARKLGIATVAVYSEADKNALHVNLADEAVPIGPAPASQSYLAIENIIAAVKSTNSQAVHPGYGFLSENSSFVQRLEQEDIVFIGPPARAIESMGDKLESKKLAKAAGVSTVPGHLGIINSTEEALDIARDIGYPVMIKASAGGGGKGMRVAWSDGEVAEGFRSSRSEAASSFGDDRIIIEKYVVAPRHIEIQVLADKFGNCLHLNERECSIQRRNQKVIEEAPSPFLDPGTRKVMGEQAVNLAKAVDYHSAGTVEFIVDKDKNFYFLEMNTRLQVEHPVTELTTNIDIVEQMIRVANDEALDITQDQVPINGWALESRVYAEDPRRNFLPSTGRLSRYKPPQENSSPEKVVRNDTGVYEGGEISVHYDPMIAKLCTWAPDRDGAIDAMQEALDCFEIAGIATNLPFLSTVYDHPRFIAGNTTTAFIEEEFQGGFKGSELGASVLHKIAACAAFMFYSQESRNARISGRMSNHSRTVGRDWIVITDKTQMPVVLEPHDCSCKVELVDGPTFDLETRWRPGQNLATFTFNQQPIHLKVNPIPFGFRVEYRGAELDVLVKTKRQVELSAVMKEIQPPDTTRFLLCPMPGLVVEILVKEGDSVEEGQPLCIIEAMKMENVLKATRPARISSIKVATGDSLVVDQTIMEFD